MSTARERPFQEQERVSGVWKKGSAVASTAPSAAVCHVGGAVSELLGHNVIAVCLAAPMASGRSTAGLSWLSATPAIEEFVVSWLERVPESGVLRVPDELRDAFGAPRALAVTLRTPVWKAGIIVVPLTTPRDLLPALKSLCTDLALELEKDDRYRRLSELGAFG